MKACVSWCLVLPPSPFPTPPRLPASPCPDVVHLPGGHGDASSEQLTPALAKTMPNACAHLQHCAFPHSWCRLCDGQVFPFLFVLPQSTHLWSRGLPRAVSTTGVCRTSANGPTGLRMNVP